jgi:hypothetical protein
LTCLDGILGSDNVHLLPERLAAAGLTRAAGIIPAVTS